MNKEVPFSLMKKTLYIQDSQYPYCIDEDGYGVAIIDGYRIKFYMNEYGEIVADSIEFDN